MRKLQAGQETIKLGLNVRKTLRNEFYAVAKERGFERMEGRFFEIMFGEWKELRLQREILSAGPHRSTGIIVEDDASIGLPHQAGKQSKKQHDR